MNTLSDRDARTWGMLCHLAALAGFIIPFGGSILGPLVMWLIKREEHEFVNEQGKESLNFQISILIYGIISGILCIILIGFLLLLGLFVFNLVMVILASVSANDGKSFHYPLCIRFIR